VEENILAALALTLFAGLATGIGSLISYFIPKPDMRYLSLSLGFAAGVMIYVGFVDLFFSAKAVLGLGYANFFYAWILAAASALVAGIMVFICFDELIPIANKYGSEHLTNLGIIAGFFIMMIGLGLMENF
jgi:zinc transporter, ZIP family